MRKQEQYLLHWIGSAKSQESCVTLSFMVFSCRIVSITLNFELNAVNNSLGSVAADVYTKYRKYPLRVRFIFKSIWKQYSEKYISFEE
jgi:hypothetical protein